MKVHTFNRMVLRKQFAVAADYIVNDYYQWSRCRNKAKKSNVNKL